MYASWPAVPTKLTSCSVARRQRTITIQGSERPVTDTDSANENATNNIPRAKSDHGWPTTTDKNITTEGNSVKYPKEAFQISNDEAGSVTDEEKDQLQSQK